MGAEYDADAAFMITDTYIKFWPAEYHSQSAIDAALQLRQQIGDVSKVAAVDIYTFEAVVQHHRQVRRGVGPEDPRDGRPQPAVLHGRRAARRRSDARASSTRPGSPPRTSCDLLDQGEGPPRRRADAAVPAGHPEPDRRHA